MMIDRLLLGDYAFDGVDRYSEEKPKDYVIPLGVETISNVIKVALKSGAQGLSFSVSPNMYNVLRHLKLEEYDREFGLYPILPDAASTLRLEFENGILGMMTNLFGKMSIGTKAKSLVQGGAAALEMDPIKMMKTYLEGEISIFMRAVPKGAKLKAVFLHQMVSDLMLSFQMKDLFSEYVGFVSDSFEVMPGFVTKNFARFADFVIDAGYSSKDLVIMTPFNKAGFEMIPSKESCEEALSKIPKAQVIAMHMLALGYRKLDEATEYINSLPRKVSCVVGVSKESYAEKTFSYLHSRLA